VHNLAGFVGEDMAGLSHPSSSIDERAKAWIFSEAVAAVANVPAEAVAAFVCATCERVIRRNRTAFDALRAHLYRTKRLTKTEAARMLVGVC
jgi:thioredoxin-like negative regulator of GroEL